MESMHVAETVGVGWVVDRVEVVLVDDGWEFRHYQISFQIRCRGPSEYGKLVMWGAIVVFLQI